MSFASPWMLLGLVALLIPLWLHFRRRNAVRVIFPSTLILAKVAKQGKRRLQMWRLALLIARLLFLLVLICAVARPRVAVRRPGGIRTGAALALVIVFDDSLSMQFTGNGEQAIFDRGKELAHIELDRLRPGDTAAIVFSGQPVRSPYLSPEFDLTKLRRTIELAKPTYASGDLAGALRIASRILEQSPFAAREVVVLTDLAEEIRANRLAPWLKESDIRLRVIDAAKNATRANHAVDQVRVAASPAGVSREVVVEVRVANHSSTALVDFDVVLDIDGAEVAQGSVDVPAYGTAIKRFYHRFDKAGIHRGLAHIAHDRLIADDERHFWIAVRESIAALVIDGDYRPGSYLDEAFYLKRALQTPIPDEVPIQPVVVDVATAGAGTLSGNDVVFLAGVPEIAPQLGSRIIDYVKRGGGLFVSPSPRSGNLNLIEQILPAKIRSVRQAPKSNHPFRILALDHRHPVFQLFSGGPTGLEKTEIKAHLLVEPEPIADRHTLLELADGLPLLLERRVERGTAMLLTTTIDREWTDLPIRPGFLPLIQRAARHLAGRLSEKNPRQIPVGQPVPIEVSEGMRRLLVRGPHKEDTIYPAVELEGQSAMAFLKTDLPGFYEVWADIPEFGGLRNLFALGFVAETDPRESNLAKIASAQDKVDSSSFEMIEGKLPIWPYLLIAALLLLFVETWLSGLGLRRSHLSGHETTARPERMSPN